MLNANKETTFQCQFLIHPLMGDDSVVMIFHDRKVTLFSHLLDSENRVKMTLKIWNAKAVCIASLESLSALETIIVRFF